MRFISFFFGKRPFPFVPDLISQEHAWWFVVGAVLCITGVFHSYIDIYISAWVADVYRSGFPLDDHALFIFLHESARLLTGSIIIFVFGTLIIQVFEKRRRPPCAARIPFYTSIIAIAPKALAFVALLWIIAPGLIINGVLKEHSGRARPNETTLFGGDKLFSPAFIISNQCESNCSFSAGDPSTGFALIGLAVIDRKRRRQWLLLSVLAGSLLGITRIVQGKHFLFDVLVSAYVVYGVNRLLLGLAMFKEYRLPVSSTHKT